MNKFTPDWGVWKHVPDVDAREAVALTLNLEPRASRVATAPQYTDRLFLIQRALGRSVRLSLTELAKWAQSVGWNIPVELGALTPAPTPEYVDLPADLVVAAMDGVIAPSARSSELIDALAAEGWRFVALDSGGAIHIPDGTTEGKLEPLAQLYGAISSLCYTTKNSRIAHLVRASGASGGGAAQSNYRHAPMPASPIPAIEVSSNLESATLSKKGTTTASMSNVLPAIPTQAKSWQDHAQAAALKYIARHKAQNLYPSQSDVASAVEVELRAAGVLGDSGRPVSAEYVARNALRGKWWAQNKPKP